MSYNRRSFIETLGAGIIGTAVPRKLYAKKPETVEQRVSRLFKETGLKVNGVEKENVYSEARGLAIIEKPSEVEYLHQRSKALGKGLPPPVKPKFTEPTDQEIKWKLHYMDFDKNGIITQFEYLVAQSGRMAVIGTGKKEMQKQGELDGWKMWKDVKGMKL